MTQTTKKKQKKVMHIIDMICVMTQTTIEKHVLIDKVFITIQLYANIYYLFIYHVMVYYYIIHNIME
jgi:hypothetical protein